MSAITTEQMLALITAQSKQIEALTAAVERLSMATPTKVQKIRLPSLSAEVKYASMSP